MKGLKWFNDKINRELDEEWEAAESAALRVWAKHSIDGEVPEMFVAISRIATMESLSAVHALHRKRGWMQHAQGWVYAAGIGALGGLLVRQPVFTVAFLFGNWFLGRGYRWFAQRHEDRLIIKEITDGPK